jgi:hypothetical protein
MKLSILNTHLRDRRLRFPFGMVTDASFSGTGSGLSAAGDSDSNLSWRLLDHRLPISLISATATATVGTAQSARRQAAMAAPRGPASHEMMNPDAVSSSSKTISQLGLSAITLIMRRPGSFVGRGMPSDPLIAPPSHARSTSVRLYKLRQNNLRLLVHDGN